MTRGRTHAGAAAVLLGAILVVAAAVGCAPASDSGGSQPPPSEAEALLKLRCTVCHSLDRVYAANKTQSEWESTIARMVSRGAKLDASEQAQVITYLLAR